MKYGARIIAVLVFALMLRPLVAQTPNIGGGGVTPTPTPNQPQINIQGPIIPGDCVIWINATTIGDSGSPCGSSPGTPCTAGALDLSLTTGCNIPFYVGGVFP